MTEPLTDTELDEIERWTRAYRTLMRGGLGGVVHTAGVSAFVDPDDEDRFPTLRVDVVEHLVAEVRHWRRIADDTCDALGVAEAEIRRLNAENEKCCGNYR